MQELFIEQQTLSEKERDLNNKLGALNKQVTKVQNEINQVHHK